MIDGNNRYMIIIPIIFLTISVLIFLLFLLKIKIKIFFEVNNLSLKYKVKILFKEINKKYNLEELNKDDKSNHNKEHNKENTKGLKIKKILKLVRINSLNISAYIGLLFLFPTIIGTTILNSLIPIIYNCYSDKKSKLSYKVNPLYDSLRLYLFGEIVLNTTPFKLLKIIYEW